MPPSILKGKKVQLTTSDSATPSSALQKNLEDAALPENLEWFFLRGHGEQLLEGSSPSALGVDEPRRETSCYNNTARQCDEHFYLQI